MDASSAVQACSQHTSHPSLHWEPQRVYNGGPGPLGPDRSELVIVRLVGNEMNEGGWIQINLYWERSS